jgi:hypothetical protein
MGGSNGLQYGGDYLRATINTSSSGPTLVCTRVFTTRGRPHLSFQGTSGGACPAGYTSVPGASLQGTNGYAYFLSNRDGAYLGYVDSWDYNSQAFGSGFQYRYWTPALALGTACLKVMGVEEDPSTQLGVFPVLFGVKASTACPTGFTYQAANLLAGPNNYTYSLIDDNTSAFSGLYSWGWGGENYMSEYFTTAEAVNYCWKYYPLTGKPVVNVRAVGAGACPGREWLERQRLRPTQRLRSVRGRSGELQWSVEFERLRQRQPHRRCEPCLRVGGERDGVSLKGGASDGHVSR